MKKKKKPRAEDKLRLVKEIVRKQLGTVAGGRGCLTVSSPPENGTNSCAGPP